MHYEAEEKEEAVYSKRQAYEVAVSVHRWQLVILSRGILSLSSGLPDRTVAAYAQMQGTEVQKIR